MIMKEILTGKTFNNWLVLNETKIINKKTYWKCQCNCKDKNIQFVRSDRLKNGNCKGCKKCVNEYKRTHSMSNTLTYHSWQHMKARCYDKNHHSWEHYGGRGIKICDRWLNSFENFLSDMGERPKEKTLDRFPNKDGNYELENCRWATKAEQSQNTRNTKLNPDIVKEIRFIYNNNSNITHRELAQRYNISRTVITLIINNKIWKNVI